MKLEIQYHLSQLGECIYGAQIWKEKRLFCESVFVQIDKRILILKMVQREVSLTKPMHQYHLYQRGEIVYGA